MKSRATCPACGAPLSPDHPDCRVCGRDSTTELELELDTADVSEAHADPAVGQMIGEFLIEATIGRGGMGTVYRAWQESMHRKVALKVMAGGAFPSGGEVSRFEREAWIGGRLSHANIVKVFSQGADGTSRYIAMELVEGESLYAEIQRRRRGRAAAPDAKPSVDPAEIRNLVSLFVGVADALVHVHGQGIVHRDIKPLNLLLPKERNRLLLTDFGLARDEEASRVTRRGDFLGTVRYMSPEQLLAHRMKVDHRTDIWSLGVALYESVTLGLPYSAPSEEAYISAVATKEPVPARVRNRVLPRDLETILMKCLERDPEQRYGSAAELRDDLVRLLGDRSILARRPGPLERATRFARRHRALLLAAGLATAVAVVGLAAAGRWVQDRRDLDRIRWTLDQVVTGGGSPSSLQQDWDSLELRLQKEMRRDPRGELTTLAWRAAPSLRVSVPPYGLISEPPEFAYGVSANLGIEFAYLADLEGSWDGGAWRPFGWLFGDEIRQGIGRESLETIVPREKWTGGPHRLDLRARIKTLDPGSVSAERLHTPSLRRPVEETKPAELAGPGLFTQIRSLGSFPITLFEHYPADFPVRLRETASTGRVADWFRVDRVRVIRTDLPEGFAPCFAYDIEKGFMGMGAGRTPTGRAARNGLASAIMLLGRMDAATPLPVAAEASLWMTGAERPLLRFPVVFGASRISVGEQSVYYNVGKWSGTWSDLSGNLATGQSVPRWIATPPADGRLAGRLELSPSREVALRSKWLESYFGERVRFPVEIELSTVQGRWAAAETCGEISAD